MRAAGLKWMIQINNGPATACRSLQELSRGADIDPLRLEGVPSKTRVFVDFFVELFQRERYPERFAGSLG